jgi:hypothetical protein
MESRKSQFIIAAALALSLTGSASGEQQPSATPVEFHIASQPLAHALNAWAQQCGLQLIWPADGARSLYGKYQPLQALAFLLQDSGLQYSVLKEGTVTLGERTADGSAVVSVKATSEQP